MKSALSIVLFCCLVGYANASPWIEYQDTRLRHQINMLVSNGVLDLSTSTWPLMWTDVARSIEDADRARLSKPLLLALKQVEFELNRNKRSKIKKELSFFASNSSSPISSPVRIERGKGKLTKSFEYDGDQFAFRLDANLRSDSDGEYSRDLYGSYYAQNVGNWVFGAGAIERWWGPGQRSSLILSNNALPIPAVFLRTMGQQRFESDYLSWIGPWQFQMFVGQLEGSRHIPEAKLTGMRFSFRPANGLEIGASRAMQWGGRNRENSFMTFFDSVFSRGENTNDGAGNQLGGFDFRYTTDEVLNPMSFYGQINGEDEAGYLPSKYNFIFGVAFPSAPLSGYIEYSETAAGALARDEQYNAAYEHFVYQSGFRYRSRSIGSVFDNDARVLSIGWKFVNYTSHFDFELDWGELNSDGSGKNSLVDSNHKFYGAFFKYSTDWRYVRANLGVRYLSIRLPFNESQDRAALSFEVTHRF